MTGRKLDRYATVIKGHVIDALKDPEVRSHFARAGNAEFYLQDVPEVEDLDYLRNVIVHIADSRTVAADAAYEFDLDASPEQRKSSDLRVNLSLPRNFPDHFLGQVSSELMDAIRHELEHSGQETWELMDCQRKTPSADVIWKSLKSAAEYYLCPAEVKAHIAGFMKRAKFEKVPLGDVIDRELYRVFETGKLAGHSGSELHDFMAEVREQYYAYARERYPKAQGLLREYIRGLLIETAIGQCYPHAVKMAQGSSQEEFSDLTKFKVAHGRVTDKFSGESYLHAWVEKGDMIFDWQTHDTKPDGIDRETYYDIFQPEIHNEYTAEETMVNCLKSGQAGPWTMQESVLLETAGQQLQAGISLSTRSPKDLQQRFDAFMKEYESLTKRNPIGYQGDRYWYMGEVEGKHCLVITNMNIFDGSVSFNSIQTVPPDVCEKKGFASKVMNQIVALADKHQVPMTLSAVPFGQKSLGEKELESWYRRAGFDREDEYEELRREPK